MTDTATTAAAGTAGAVETLTYRDALRLALDETLAADPTVVVLGEEVGRYGGAYGVTKGLYDRYGPDRVRDTPISEAGIVGAAVGAAMTGLRPVVELMYVDFLGLAMDQVANQAAKIRHMFGGQIGVPMVLRTQGGTGRSAGAQHSQSLEGWVWHTPGLRVAMPGTVTDAYVLLKAALTQPDPVVFIEHKALYTQSDPFEPDQAPAWGQTACRRDGTRATVVTYSRMVHSALAAAESLATEGLEVAVFDLRTLNPLDLDPVVTSTIATGRCLVVTEAALTAGPGAELAARIQEQAFDYLEEPVVRLAGEDVPIAVAPALEAAAIPSPERIAATLRTLIRRR